MIVVIADDLTGAAEIGGLGLRHGFSVEIVTNADFESKADILIIAENTRSMPKKQALLKMAELSAILYHIKPHLIFKKVDSVLRGHIVAELKIHLHQLDLPRALLVPANPALGRTLTDGKYFIDGRPIHLSSFADDPEFPITSSNVYNMLRVEENELHIKTKNDELPQAGIIVGECATKDDLKTWATKTEKNILLAGGSGFFETLLENLSLKRKIQLEGNNTAVGLPALFVCGSNFNRSIQLVEKAYDCGAPVSYMPLEIILADSPFDANIEKWANEVVSLLEKHKKAIIAVHRDSTKNRVVSAESLREKNAIAVKKIFQKIAMRELFVEGGATTAAILKHLNHNRFYPVKEYCTGVIRMSAGLTNNFFLTLKPGSYEWPSHIWPF